MSDTSQNENPEPVNDPEEVQTMFLLLGRSNEQERYANPSATKRIFQARLSVAALQERQQQGLADDDFTAECKERIIDILSDDTGAIVGHLENEPRVLSQLVTRLDDAGILDDVKAAVPRFPAVQEGRTTFGRAL